MESTVQLQARFCRRRRRTLALRAGVLQFEHRDCLRHAARLLRQVAGRRCGRGEVPAGQRRDQPAVGLLGERVVRDAAAQPGAEVPDGEAASRPCRSTWPEKSFSKAARNGGRRVDAKREPNRLTREGTVTPGVTVHSNRGANGIDGVIATAIGVAAGSQQPTVLLIGDVAFCHDQSSLTALAARGVNLTVVVVDNDGGGIFSFLPQRTQLSTERFEQLFGTPHGTDLVALARAHGLGARTVSTRNELLQAVADREAMVVRVESNRAANVAVHDALHAAVAAALTGE